jgi:hypothetical protein
MPAKRRSFYDEPEPTRPRLTFAHERAAAVDGIYVSPPVPPDRPGADLNAWGADAGRAANAAHASARDEETRQRAGQVAANPWRTSVFELPPEARASKRDGLLGELRALGERSADDERAPAAQQQPSAEEDRTGQFAATKMDPPRPRKPGEETWTERRARGASPLKSRLSHVLEPGYSRLFAGYQGPERNVGYWRGFASLATATIARAQ